jgi:hypothetical protein
MSNHPAYRLKKHRDSIDIQTVTWYTEIVILRAAKHSEPLPCSQTPPLAERKNIFQLDFPTFGLFGLNYMQSVS